MTQQQALRRTWHPRSTDDGCQLRFAPCLPGPESLVGLGFRYWMLGRQTGDISIWERAWDLYCDKLGISGARSAITSLSNWAAAVDLVTCREIELFPEPCTGFCRDECLAVGLIASCQHGTCPQAHSYARALAGSSTIDQVLHDAQDFADTLTGLQQHLSSGVIVASPVAMSNPLRALSN